MNFQILYASFIVTVAFGIIFNVPKKTLFSGGLIGMLGWTLYSWLTISYAMDTVSATMISAFSVATISQLLARYYKMPVTVFSLAGIIPLVPGGLAYDTMRHFVENNYDVAIKLAAKSFMISGAIAFGLVLSGVISQTIGKKNR